MLFYLAMLSAQAQDCSFSHDVMLVGVEESAPFAMKVNGNWHGISVDLWEKIAKENGWEFRYVEDRFQNLLTGVSNCRIDVALPGITVTPERELVMDFSRTYLVEDVAVATNASRSYIDILVGIAEHLMRPLGALMVVLSAAGVAYFLCEKREGRLRGLLDSVYWALTTMVTVGYGDEAPKGVLGRLFAMFWMLVALFIFASINAKVLEAFTKVSWVPEIDDLTDLRDHNVLTIEGTFSEELLRANGVSYKSVADERELFETVKGNEKYFVVYDRSILNYYLGGEFTVLDNGFYDQHLAFAVRPEFPQLEEVNQGVLSSIQTDWWSSTTFKYQTKE